MSNFDREKWDAKYAAIAAGQAGDANHGGDRPSTVLVGLEQYLPTRGKGLDLAGGAGRNALWLAKRGLAMTIADVSPRGLAIARDRAAAASVEISLLTIDLEEKPFPPGPWDLILSVCYLHRPLFRDIPAALSPGGRIVVIQPTIKNLERHEKPPASFLLEPRELKTLVPSLRVLHYCEDWSTDGRHDAVLVAEK